ncbi:MAG: response regulator transcription factor [Rhodospirillaceae bacterium]|nr:response regulator transcription factor [Rhodospirillaceae bacterium]
METELPHILVVDDDRRLRDLLRRFLSDNGFRVTVAGDAREARATMENFAFDALVLDVMMPGETGLHLAADLRQKFEAPILMLTAMGESEDRIAGFEHGADDYLVKPFEPRELVLRLRALLRRIQRPVAVSDELRLGAFRFRLDRLELFKGHEHVKLTETEARLLGALARKAGTPMSREELAAETGAEGGERAIDVQVTRLRRKLRDDPRGPRYLQTARGKGYMLLPD